MTKQNRQPWGGSREGPRAALGGTLGFTLIELLVVMVIISILLGFILNAASGAVKRAQERATQALISKLEGGLNDRFDALMQTRPDPNSAHLAMAAVYNSGYYPNANIPGTYGSMPGALRAQAIAWYDYIKREMPDTFFVQNTGGPYPLNFAANPYPLSGGTATDPNGLGLYILPLGNSITSSTVPPLGDGSGTGYSATSANGLMEYNPAGAGIYGASYPVAAGIYKNLGYLPQGFDGVDNTGEGLVDEYAEGIGNNPMVPTPNNPQVQIPLATLIADRLSNHKHATARAEMLYALLVEGRGPLGSVFNADDFTDQEVKDTDNDGLPEFVDAWGNPLQFFRWPLLYYSDIQLGQVIQPNGENSWTLIPPYLNALQQREQDPLDLNQQLVAPAWWSSSYNNSGLFSGYPSHANGVGGSGAVQAFEYYFHRLTEPIGGAGGALYWDRGSSYGGRRAFYSKFLVVSGGLDQQLGVFLYSDAAIQGFGQNAAWPLIANENNAMPFSVVDFVDFTTTATYGGFAISYNPSLDPTSPSSSDLLQAAKDDISNQNVQSTVGIGGGG